MRSFALALTLAMPALATGAPPVRAQPGLPFSAYPLFSLSNATGLVRSTWASVTYDRSHDELYVVDGGIARIFNKAGMEVHSFGADEEVGLIYKVAVLADGDLVVISNVNGRRSIFRCDFRGSRLAAIELKGLPPGFGLPFQPDTVEVHEDELYFAETAGGRVVVTDVAGAVHATYVLRDVARLGEKKHEAVAAFSVDGEGNMLFTIPTLFSAFVVSPEGEVRRFGAKGSAPGRFNIAGKLVRDEVGNFYVTDRLRCVVMVFDKGLNYLGEFGYRGEEPENLIVPYDLAVGNGKVFVAQAGNRGVKVFRLAFK